MHIAICDDNVADRKQLERLLDRESDKRLATSSNLYIDSYGNAISLLANPMQYDAFFIDMCKTPGTTGIDVVNSLSQAGVQAPVVMCCSDINYREQDFPLNVIFLDKPIKVAELHEAIEYAQTIKDQSIPMIELREDKETLYVTEEMIMYAVEDGRNVDVTLTNGRTVRVSTNVLNLLSQVENHPSFFAPTNKVLINGRYIAKIGFRKVIMNDGTSFKVHRDCIAYAKYIYKEYNEKRRD